MARIEHNGQEFVFRRLSNGEGHWLYANGRRSQQFAHLELQKEITDEAVSAGLGTHKDFALHKPKPKRKAVRVKGKSRKSRKSSKSKGRFAVKIKL